MLAKLSKIYFLAIFIFCSPLNANADAASNVDKNILIIFPPDVMKDTLNATTPELLGNLKYTDANDKNQTANAVQSFQQQFLQKFQVLVTASLKQNFTPEELQQWADFQNTPLGNKTMLWLKTKYPAILNQAMDEPMQNLYKDLGGN